MPEVLVRVVYLDVTPYIHSHGRSTLCAASTRIPTTALYIYVSGVSAPKESASHPTHKVSKDVQGQIPSSSHPISSSPVTHSHASFFRPRDHPLPSNALAHRPRTRPVRSGQPRPAQPSPVQVSTPPASSAQLKGEKKKREKQKATSKKQQVKSKETRTLP